MPNTCSKDDCDKPVFARKLCAAHYSRLMRYGDTDTVHKQYESYVKPQCSVDGCGRDTIAQGYCTKHYQRWKKFGDPLATRTKADMTTEERFWSFVNKDGPVSEYRPDLGPCWVWTGALTHGYGAFSVGNRQTKAHIFSFTLIKGAIPSEHERDHLCRVRACVNPDHLEAVIHWINVARGISPHGKNAVKTHCKRGHEFTPENTRRDRRGSRHCITCARARCRKYYHSHKGNAAA